jgi:dGTPase
MLRQLADQVRIEDAYLAPYATHNRATRGRIHPEEPHPFRTDFQRDRDRILHSRSFRRLEYKTQVFLNGTGDHLRTRLTHTIEVAAIARTIARALNLNEDLAEAIALAHDLGHTPFGHPGERAMNELMRDHGGFDHNDQCLKIVDVLEQKYPAYDGLNLSREVRTGLIKHRAPPHPAALDGEILPPQPSLEAQVADLADDLTYYGHDVDDGLDAGLIDESMLAAIPLWQRAADKARAQGLGDGAERFRAYAVRCLIDMMVGNAILTSHQALTENAIASVEQAQNHPTRLIVFDPAFGEMTIALRNFLFQNMYFHPKISDVNNAAVDMMRQLFHACIAHPGLMGSTTTQRIAVDGLHRATADYIAGMTDRFALLEFQRCCQSGDAVPPRHGGIRFRPNLVPGH